MRHALAFLFLSFTTASLAQNRPQMTWSGYVTGGATLFIQGNKTDVQGRETGAVDRPRAQFNSALPAARIQVEMKVRRGRGQVEIVEQPEPANEFAAVVQINTPGRQPEFYTLDFYWNQNRNSEPGRNRSDRGDGRSSGGTASGGLQWSGEVDGEILIEVRGSRVSSRVVRGQSVTAEQFDISAPMPRRAVSVRLEDVNGRGQVELLEQPSQQNGYAAIVRVRDTEGGRAPYAFRLLWDSDADTSRSITSDRRSTTPVPDQGFARWVGRVDGRVRVTLQGNRATNTTVSGGPVSGMNVDFGGGPGIPNRILNDVQLRKISGRGEVRIVQLPDGRNNNAVVFDIDDPSGGADSYEVEITWR